MSVLIKPNHKLPKELETIVKFKKCTVFNFQYRSKEKPNQSTKQQERNKESDIIALNSFFLVRSHALVDRTRWEFPNDYGKLSILLVVSYPF